MVSDLCLLSRKLALPGESSRQGAASRYWMTEKWTSPAGPPCCRASTTCKAGHVKRSS